MATNSKRYRTGTVSVTNGSVNFTGAGTSWLVNVKPGDDLCLDGQQVEIDTITANGVGKLVEAWSGTSRTNVAYSIRRASQSWNDPGSLALDVAAYIDSITAIQSATSIAIGTGSKTFATPVLRNYLVGARVTIAATAAPSNAMFGTVTAMSQGSLTVNVEYTSGSGTFAAWNVTLGGRGVDGTNGTNGTNGASVPGFRNRLRNASFLINQRNVSGSIVLAPGAYGHDGCKAGAGGCTYAAGALGSDNYFDILAGSLIMPIEGVMIEGGSFTLSQAGSAQARVWQGAGSTGSGAYAACPLTTGSLTASTQTNVEFSTGTVIRPQFELGTSATAFERRPLWYEQRFCEVYFERVGQFPLVALGVAYTVTTTIVAAIIQFRTPKRAAPSLSVSDGTQFVFSGSTTHASNGIAYSNSYNPRSDRVCIWMTAATTVSTTQTGTFQTANNSLGWLDFSAEI